MAEYTFALSGVTLPGTEDLFGIWTVPTLAEVSFDMQAAEVPDRALPVALLVRELGVLLQDRPELLHLGRAHEQDEERQVHHGG